ncbi:MAG: hypothetical protein APR56_00175 [Methanosaeta sp. SDB]|jgi:tartrate dehydratase beta subunit/fumarate hydratase class I family protein|uniref:Putative cobyrinic acid A,C-diamide synthase n=1 Tax=Methanothrix harundinacea TaxID=301375 RepID=A0A117LFW6_9EURY|nr:MAG: hypothetical protein APR56_00175 [Methanosaeta sp. SDB]KUK44936.1 MAG: putative cobyrinic acid A,C-diamide synthase [Methanothrix harundinacea]KUK95797.1 MAG: putative cobyrinic acid A,C-diamide synthase [Methanothrix harundinacea]
MAETKKRDDRENGQSPCFGLMQLGTTTVLISSSIVHIRKVLMEGIDIDRILEIAVEAQPLVALEPDLYMPNRHGDV